MDERRLRRACERLLQAVSQDPAYGHTSHLLVAVDGHAVVDEHLRGAPVADVFSVTKTVLALVCGAAAARGHLPDLDTPVADLRPDLAGTAAAEHTLRHLLTMTRGAETGGAWDADEVTALPAGQVRHIAAAPQRRPAGTAFDYDNGGAHLLAAVLDGLLPGRLLPYADETLLAPLGVQDRAWWTDDTGVPYGHAHLHLSAGSLARLGQLVLQHGRWGRKQLVVSSFLAAMTTASSPGGPPELLPYGFLCWLDGQDVLAGGWAGQHVLVRRRDRVVVVVTGDPGFRPGPPPEDDLPAGWRPALDLVRRYVLPVLDGG